MTGLPSRVRACSAAPCGFWRYRREGIFFCVAFQQTMTVDERRCSFWTAQQPNADHLARVQGIAQQSGYGPENDAPLPSSESGKARLIRRVIAEKEAAAAGVVSTTALVSSGAKSQFETKRCLGPGGDSVRGCL